VRARGEAGAPTRHAGLRGVVCCLLVAAAVTSCGSAEGAKTTGEGQSSSLAAHARSGAQSAAARALHLPQMQLARVLATGASGGTMVQVRVRFAGGLPTDTAIDPQHLHPTCGAKLRDTLVAHRGDAVIGALLWVEGDVPVLPDPATTERRPIVRLERCHLQPRMQLAAPGSTVQLLMADDRTDSLIVVPTAAGARVDTISFITNGQLVPLAREIRPGVIAIEATMTPWARAFVAIAPAGTTAISDADGQASFVFARQGRKATIHAWHPVLGVASATIAPSTLDNGSVVTLSFRR